MSFGLMLLFAPSSAFSNPFLSNIICIHEIKLVHHSSTETQMLQKHIFIYCGLSQTQSCDEKRVFSTFLFIQKSSKEKKSADSLSSSSRLCVGLYLPRSVRLSLYLSVRRLCLCLCLFLCICHTRCHHLYSSVYVFVLVSICLGLCVCLCIYL